MLMEKRRYELPGVQHLNKQQDAVLALPPKGRHLIVGGPGTGKSVLALLRARRHQRNSEPCLFLVFNHILHQATRRLYGAGLDSETWMSWFHGIFSEISGESVPKSASKGADGFEPIDWTRTGEIIDAMRDIPDVERPFLIIDEGQDMPPDFYSSLVNLGFENFFVVADQNQQITSQNSSRKDIADALVINANEVIELTINHRNSLPVARLAKAFCTGDPATPLAELPQRAPGSVAVSTPRLYEYEDAEFERVARRILLTADRDPRQLIGVLAPNNAVRHRYFEALQSVQVKLDNSRPWVRTFHGDHRPEVGFDQGGTVVINAQACKGLEFDTVVLGDIDEHFIRVSDPDPARRLFYVMVARARTQVIMLMRRSVAGKRRIEAILPSDLAVLRREAM